MTDDILNRKAVSRQSGETSGKLLKYFIDTNPGMVLNHTTPEPAAAAAPKGTGGAVDPTQR
jgi:hypothetical protein